jgi:hypothetical protein
MRRTVLGIALALWLGGGNSSASPAPEPEKDWLIASVEKGARETGRIGWDGFRVGTWVEERLSEQGQAPRVGSPGTREMRHTLLERDEKGTKIRLQLREGGAKEWPAGSEYRLARVRLPDAEFTTEDLGSEEIEQAGGKTTCTKVRWSRLAGGTIVGTRTVWRDAKGTLLRWEQADGDGWIVTYDLLRLSVTHQVGTQALECREVRKVAKPAPGSGAPLGVFTSTELWCKAVPDFVVRSETTMRMPNGTSTGQLREVVGFEAK